MKLIIVENYNQVGLEAKKIFVDQIIKKPNSVLGLATGSSPLGLYSNLVEAYKKGEISFENIISFNLDEYYGLDKSHPQSYRYFMDENLFSQVNIKEENVFIPNGLAENIEDEGLDYDKKIAQYGFIDLQLLGIGSNGHIGFNEPGSRFIKETHLVDLKEETIISNSRFFDSIDMVPKKAITMGMFSIINARKIVLLASGEKKADAIYKTLKGPITPQTPSSILQLHKDVTLIIDKEAASKL